MIVLSKLFTPPYNCMPCSELLLHQGQTCKQMWWWNWYRCSVGSLRYFLPLAISPVVLKPKSLNMSTISNILRYYLESSLWSATACALTFSLICLLRNILGKYYLYTATCLPTYLGFQLSWLFPARTVRLFSTATTQAALETWLRVNNHLIIRSLLMQTLIFMLSSAIILHAKRQKYFNGFWFIQPISKNVQARKELNPEENDKQTVYCGSIHGSMPCYKFLLDGMRTYLYYGIPLDLLSCIFKQKLPRSVSELRKIRFRMTAFFLSYVGIYRLSNCFLLRCLNSNYFSPTTKHFLSAALGGISYIFLRQLTFSVLAFVVAIQAAWQTFCNQSTTRSNENKCYAFLKSFPFGKLIIQINIAYLAHCFIFQHNELPNLAKGFFRGITDNRYERIYQFITHLLTEEAAIKFKGSIE